MNLLSWLLVLELLLMLSAYIAWLAGRMAARERPDDALYKFTTVFWRTFRQKPAPLRAPVLDDAEGEGEAVGEGEIGDILGNTSHEETPAPHPGSPSEPGQSSPVRQSTVNIKVIAHSQRDQITDYDGRVLKVHVMASAEEGAANKAVIDLLTSSLGIKTHQILLVRGHYQSQKTIQISGMDQEELDRKLGGFG